MALTEFRLSEDLLLRSAGFQRKPRQGTGGERGRTAAATERRDIRTDSPSKSIRMASLIDFFNKKFQFKIVKFT
jgi:hypothetical protein